jgi:hypothetical protein
MRHSTRVRPPPASPAKKEKMLRGAGNEQKIVSLNEIKKEGKCGCLLHGSLRNLFPYSIKKRFKRNFFHLLVSQHIFSPVEPRAASEGAQVQASLDYNLELFSLRIRSILLQSLVFACCQSETFNFENEQSDIRRSGRHRWHYATFLRFSVIPSQSTTIGIDSHPWNCPHN